MNYNQSVFYRIRIDDLQDLPVFDCFDYGEWIRLRLSNHDVLGIISIEFNFYQVEKLSVVSVDGLSDISQAKILNREEPQL